MSEGTRGNVGSAHPLLVPLSPIRTNGAGSGSCTGPNGARDGTVTRGSAGGYGEHGERKDGGFFGAYFHNVPRGHISISFGRTEGTGSRTSAGGRSNGIKVMSKPPARKVAPRCVHVGCAGEQAELKASG